ncbi:MAG: Gfo/Idh/MocA family oxidoreductase, partial [Hyphomicrobiales bacterium]|nr:Gfo/Idh/MocA family oxidoreductase [Hyphomicrobiales bacterium]
MSEIHIIGCGFVADLYMKSLATFPDIRIVSVYDRDPDRLAAFCAYWSVTPAASLEEILRSQPEGRLILNLTNPDSHYEISRACLDAGFHVYSEKPLAMNMEDAFALHEIAAERGLMLASAPCSILSEAAQTLAAAIRAEICGKPRLVYAELDDDFIPQAPHDKWFSESGAPWPYEDEMRVGCTLEHAGYYLTWLIGVFGSVKTVVAASADVIPGKLADGGAAPDFSVATLFFESGMVARLTCSIVAPHDHQIRIFGEKGVIEARDAWNNDAAIRFRRRYSLRRRLINHPFPQRIRLKGPTHPKVPRTGA